MVSQTFFMLRSYDRVKLGTLPNTFTWGGVPEVLGAKPTFSVADKHVIFRAVVKASVAQVSEQILQGPAQLAANEETKDPWW